MPDTEDHPLRQFGVLEADNVNRVQLVPMDGMEHRQRLLDDMPNAEAARKLFAHREFKQTYGYIVRRIESGTPAVQVLQGGDEGDRLRRRLYLRRHRCRGLHDRGEQHHGRWNQGPRSAGAGIMRPGQVAELPHHWDAP
ncbi:MAG: hypothetical protein WDN04_13655 [Rhodospirillales bacterium]